MNALNTRFLFTVFFGVLLLFFAESTQTKTQEPAKKPTFSHVNKVIKNANSWLAKNQKPDGSWATGMGENKYAQVVTTSFAGLALLASGKEYYQHVHKAANFVAMNTLKDTSRVRLPENLDQSNWKYSIGGLFLVEYYAGLKKNPKPNTALIWQTGQTLEKMVKESIERMEDSGGWGHTPRVKNPLGYVELEVVSNWMLAFFGAAERCGINVPSYEKAFAFIENCCNPNSGDVGYSPRKGQKGFGCPCRTGGAIFGFAILGKDQSALYPLMITAWKSSMKNSNEGHGSLAIGYLGSALGARQVGDWDKFKELFFEQILNHVEKDGTIKTILGKSPQAQANADKQVGPAYTSAIYSLILQLEKNNLSFLGKQFDSSERSKGSDILRETMVRLVNEFREKEKVGNLTSNEDLMNLAQDQAAIMARRDRFGDSDKDGHVIDGKKPKDRLGEDAAENVGYVMRAKAPFSLQLSLWKGNTLKRKILLSPNWATTGVGAAQSLSGRWFFCQIYAKKGSVLPALVVRQARAKEKMKADPPPQKELVASKFKIENRTKDKVFIRLREFNQSLEIQPKSSINIGALSKGGTLEIEILHADKSIRPTPATLKSNRKHVIVDKEGKGMYSLEEVKE